MLRFLILQHPQEARKPLSTIPLVTAKVPGAVHRVGLSWRSFSAALGEPGNPREWGVLYLGALKDMKVLPEKPLQIVVRKGAPPPLSSLKGIVVLDGNWSQSKTLWWRNSWMLKLNRLVLRPETPSAYGPLRQQPRKDCLSSLEAVAACLDALTPGNKIAPELREAFQEHVDRGPENG